MIDSADYPRMMFHRSQEPVIVRSEEEEAALGAGWQRTIPQPEPDPVPSIKLPPPLPRGPDPEEEPQEVPRSQIKPHRKPPARKTTKGKGL